jgi:hypothetical protein
VIHDDDRLYLVHDFPDLCLYLGLGSHYTAEVGLMVQSQLADRKKGSGVCGSESRMVRVMFRVNLIVGRRRVLIFVDQTR